MKLSSLDRLLESPAQDLYVPLRDETDPRLCHILTRVNEVPDDAGICCIVVGVPQDVGVERNSGRKGARFAPTAIRKALYGMAVSSIQDVVQSGKLCIVDAGDIRTEGKTLEQIHDEQHDIVQNILKNDCMPIVLGGGHDTAWPTIQAFNSIGRQYGVINIDAHLDVRPLHDGGRSHSGSPFRQMLEARSSSLMNDAFVEFGIQHQAVSKTHLEYVRSKGMHIHMLDELRTGNLAEMWKSSIDTVSSAGSMYVSLDMDSIASAFAPGVSAPASDGFTSGEVIQMLRYAASTGKLTAFDIVEVNPEFDVDNRTAKLAATVLMNIFTGLAQTF